MKSFSGPKPLQLYRLYQAAKIIGTITNPTNKTVGGTSSTVSSSRLRRRRRCFGERAPAAAGREDDAVSRPAAGALWVRAIMPGATAHGVDDGRIAALAREEVRQRGVQRLARVDREGDVEILRVVGGVTVGRGRGLQSRVGQH